MIYADRPDAPNPFAPDGGVVGQSGVGVPDALMRLWTPHRMAYHEANGEAGTDEAAGTGEAAEANGEAGTDQKPAKPACPFCRIPSLDDRDGLVVHRGEGMFVVLNLYPYNPGHLLICPYRHVADLTELTAAERAETLDLAADAMTAVRKAANPDGFNVGFNQGAIAGGSINDHLHQHVVPRWQGDAGFITVIGNTKSLPLLLDQTWELVTDAWPVAGA